MKNAIEALELQREIEEISDSVYDPEDRFDDGDEFEGELNFDHHG